MKGDENIKPMMDVIPSDWDKAPVSLAHEIREFLKSVADEGTGIDSGSGPSDADLWVTVQGIEYYINIRRSNNQLSKDGKEIPNS